MGGLDKITERISKLFARDLEVKATPVTSSKESEARKAQAEKELADQNLQDRVLPDEHTGILDKIPGTIVLPPLRMRKSSEEN